jgi:undecaprenyl-diphosphatase
VIGFVVAAIIGWLSIRWLINYVSKNSLYVFAVYCAVVGVICLGFYFFVK